jgi:hypothetical protein
VLSQAEASILALKLTLTPLFIAGITVASRRFGHAVGGWLVGLPLTSGPVSVFLALEQGTTFAREAAAGMIAGLIAVAAFCTIYIWLARTRPWHVCLALGLVTFAAVAAILAGLPKPLALTYAATLVVLIVAYRLLPRHETQVPHVATPSWDLPARTLVATTVVLVLTGVAHLLGPNWTGVLAPFPVFASVLGTFAHRHAGPPGATMLLRGVLLGLFSFASFFLIVGTWLDRAGLAPTYLAAAATAVAVNAASWIVTRRRRPVNEEPLPSVEEPGL